MSNNLVILDKKSVKKLHKVTDDGIFSLLVQGNGMIGSRIGDSDIIFVRSQEKVDNGEIAVVLVGEKAMLSQVYYYPDKQQLLLVGSKSETSFFDKEEIDKVKILGKVMACCFNPQPNRSKTFA
ncbi:MAG: hypothetical protein OSJ74_00045 [Clostridia bacterium]|nr:hypothetical protein [Clostridia bacterium]